MAGPLALKCRCGAVTGTLSARSAKAGLHLLCHCTSCRAFQVALGQPDPGVQAGVDILQIAPAGLEIDGEIAALRLSPRGPFRFYAPCCGTPIATTATTPRLPFAGVLTGFMETPERLGPIRAHAYVPTPDGPAKHRNGGRMARRLLANAASAYLRGEARVTPFFDRETGAPVVEPEVIDKARKDRIFAGL